MKKRNYKIGLSPVVATVLLIAMVIVIALIVFLWFRSLTEEAITKNLAGSEKNIQLVCDDVYFESSYSTSSNELLIRNSGNIPIYGFKIKISGDGSYTTSDLKDLSDDWETNYQTGLNQGMSFFDTVIFPGSPTGITLIPVLIGNSEKGKKTYTCNEEQHGYEIIF